MHNAERELTGRYHLMSPCCILLSCYTLCPYHSKVKLMALLLAGFQCQPNKFTARSYELLQWNSFSWQLCHIYHSQSCVRDHLWQSLAPCWRSSFTSTFLPLLLQDRTFTSFARAAIIFSVLYAEICSGWLIAEQQRCQNRGWCNTTSLAPENIWDVTLLLVCKGVLNSWLSVGIELCANLLCKRCAGLRVC